jgi:glycosyltransferase involved in cell wall biosynthesis
LNILPSYDEGFGLSYIESGYVGTPSVLSNTPIFHEIAGQAALFANPSDPKDIAQKISELYYDNMKRQKLKIEAFTRAQDFSPERFKKRWQEVLKKYLA